MAGDHADTLIPADLAAGDSSECRVDLATGEVVLTAPLAELLGFTEDRRLTLGDLRARIHPADRQRIAEEIAAALDDAAMSMVCTRFRILRQDGSATWLEARDRIERDSDGRAVATNGTMRAVPGRQRSEQPADHDWGRFEAALANTSIVLFQQDLALRYTWIHDPKRGFKAQGVLGKSDAELIGPELAGPIEAIKRRVIESGRSARQEVAMQGEPLRGRYDLHVEPQRDHAGAVVGVTCAAIEIALERGGTGAPSKLRQAIGDRDALLDRIDAGHAAGAGDRGLFTICIDVLRRKLSGYGELTREDSALLGMMEKKRGFVPARQRLNIASAANRSWLIGNGWVYSYQMLASGERQVMGFHLPGDLIGAIGPGSEGFSYVAVTDCVLCEFDRSMAMKLRRSETVLPDALRWSDAREAAILQQHLISIGRRSAIARVAHLLLELGARLKLVGLADDDGYSCPLSQELLGDALGLTKIHVNRMLRELRELGCLTFRNGYVSFGHIRSLTDLAEFDPAYLDLRAQPAGPIGPRAQDRA